MSLSLPMRMMVAIDKVKGCQHHERVPIHVEESVVLWCSRCGSINFEGGNNWQRPTVHVALQEAAKP